MADGDIVLIGIGEIGGVLAQGFLRLGCSVHPVTRQTDMAALAGRIAEPALTVVAVGENDLQPVLARIPESWRSHLCLLQNELLPNDWREIRQPTVASIWFEKKPGIEPKVIMPSPVYGPRAELFSRALSAVAIPCAILDSEQALLEALVVKNLYILTSNIAGLRTGGTVGELWRDHRDFATRVATEVIRLQEALTGESFDHAELIERMLEAFSGDPDHRCRGRSAPERLARALAHADELGIELPLLQELQAETAELQA